MAKEFLIALGSNLGSQAGGPAETLSAAVVNLNAQGLSLRRLSRFYTTPCFPAEAGPDYVNAAAAIASDLPAPSVLDTLHRIEAEFGRKRQQRWGSRSLDLDLLAMGPAILPDADVHAAWRDLPAQDQQLRAPDQLILPHPRLHERAFVLVPLADIAPFWRHPVLGVTVAEMAGALTAQARQEVVAL